MEKKEEFKEITKNTIHLRNRFPDLLKYSIKEETNDHNPRNSNNLRKLEFYNKTLKFST